MWSYPSQQQQLFLEILARTQNSRAKWLLSGRTLFWWNWFNTVVDIEDCLKFAEMISCINIVKMKWNKMRQLLQSLQEEDWYSKPAFWCYWIYCTKVLRIKCNDIRCFLAHEKRGSHIDNYLGANCKIKRNAHAQQGEIKLSNSCIWFGTCQIRRLTPRRSCVALCDWNSRILSFK